MFLPCSDPNPDFPKWSDPLFKKMNPDPNIA